jgi:hypothetical protein
MQIVLKSGFALLSPEQASSFRVLNQAGIYGGDDGTRNSALVVGCANSGDYSAVVVSGPLSDND